MSRTDRHRPHWVQLADPLERNRYRFAAWPAQGVEDVLIHPTCSCRWHNMYYERKAEHRQRRQHDQRRSRDALKGNLMAWDEG